MAYAMLFLVVCGGLSFTPPCIASVQTPTLSSCSSAQVFSVSAVSITNAKVGQTMIFAYSGQLMTSLANSPELQFTMTKKASGDVIPCISDVGSCVYKLCGGTTSIERQIGQPWNNECPIPASSYSSSLSFKIPSLAAFFIGDGNMHLKVAAIDGGTVVGCKEFDFKVWLS
ncbi:putative immunoglobulin-binding protein [Ixodes scapularis]|uniref:Immunoglobulin-binding protein, putative n=1 Tax=Ixodes scapularis TaxID=6945 RepID=B7PXV2_IXOSC|nr:immunoglobulin-binding protein, putative [Ixodes scapularis]|eukprot:XP_002401890.1 immunoglobulin-binding protein, putative [Ixodes scapularis]